MGLVHTPQEQTPWVDAGNGVRFQFQDPEKSTTDLMIFCREVNYHDMIYVRLQESTSFPATVDIGRQPHIIQQGGQNDIRLLAQVSNMRFSSNYTYMDCDCYDEVNDDWYTVKIVIDRGCPSKTEAELSMRLQPIKDFGAPAPNMQKAFAEFFRAMHPSEEQN